MKYEDIAIIGISGRFPEAENLEQFWRNLADGRDSIREYPESRKREIQETFGRIQHRVVRNGYLDSITAFDAPYFKISSEEAKFLDPQHRLSLEMIEEAIQSSGYGIGELSKEKISTFIAFNPNRYGVLLKEHPLTVANSLESALAGRVAYSYDFKGPAVTVDTACSASMVALHQACVSLIAEESQYAIIAGCHLFPVPSSWDFMKHYPIFAKSEKLSAFAEGADGTLGGEGGGAIIIKKLTDALRDDDIIYAVIKGSATNSDAALSNGFTSPSPVAQTQLIKDALASAKLGVDDITYFEAHGTGTTLGDPIEVQGVADAFHGRRTKLPIGTVKTNIGHLVGMAGFAGIAKAVMSFKYRQIPASLNFTRPNPHINFSETVVEVNAQRRDVPIDAGKMRVCVSSFGIIGTNGHVVLEEPPQRAAMDGEGHLSVYLVPLSATNENALYRQTTALCAHLRANPEIELRDIAYTLSRSRRHLKYRAAFMAKTTQDLVSQLETYIHSRVSADAATKTLYVLPPIDSFGNGLCDLKIYRKQFDLAAPHFQQNVQAESQTALVAALDTLLALGIKPAAILGWGTGRALADYIKGKTDHASLAECLSHDREADPLGIDDKLREAIAKGFSRCCIFGAGEVPRRIAQSAALAGSNNLSIDGSDAWGLLAFIAEQYISGADINWTKLYSTGTGRKILLPAYQFERLHYIVPKSQLNSAAPDFESDHSPVSSTPRPAKGVESRDIEALLVSIVRESLPGDLQTALSYLDNGGDSLAMLDVIERVKKEFDLEVDFDAFYDAASVGELLKDIQAKLGGVQTCAVAENADSFLGQDDVRSTIAQIFQSNLPELLRADESFADNGGDSLAVITIIEDLEKHYAVELAVDDFYEEPTLQHLFDKVIAVATGDVAGEEAQKPTNDNSLALADPAAQPTSKGILVTGATGFLGAHCIHEILMTTGFDVYCLVRGETDAAALARFERTLAYYFGEDITCLIDRRIHIVCGDITENHLGLTESVFQSLSARITKVLHTAADIRQLGYSKQLEKTNVNGTLNVIKFCMDGVPKELHHCSTYVVAGRSDSSAAFTESDLSRDQSFMGSAYARTKYESELLVKEYAQRGLKASIYRVGNLIGRYRDGGYQRNIDDNLIYTSIRAVAKLGRYPGVLAEEHMEMCPVDLCARALTKLLMAGESIGKTYHLMYPGEQKFGAIFEKMCHQGLTLVRDENRDQFEEYLARKAAQSDQKHIFSMFKLFYRGTLEEVENPLHPRTVFDVGITRSRLSRLGFEWPQLNEAYFSKMLTALLSIDRSALHSTGIDVIENRSETLAES